MLRRMLVPIFGAIALLLLAGPASAAPRVPNGIPFGPALIPEGELCPLFPVTLEGVSPTVDASGGPSQIVRTTLPDGTTILTGPFVLTVTNTENGRSATFNVSGPTFTGADGQMNIRGTAVVLEFGSLAPPGPAILAVNGRGIIDAELNFHIETFKGHVSNVCDQLS
jgi:hypothetical protein